MAQTFWTTAKHWVDQQTTTGGVATFAPVDGGGNAIFTTIYAQQFTPETNTTTPTAVPHAALKATSADKKTITVNVTVGTVLGVLGATLLAAPDGTIVHAHIMGV
jgi:hypothetical protein